MLVSMIVPFYNVEPYFRRCLDSIVNQSYQNLEIILVNDCSPDNSIDIAREYAQKDNRIIIIEHENSSHVGGARNTGMNTATGEYVWFIDSDDEIAHPYAVDHLLRIARRDDSDIILFRAQMLTHEHQKIHLFGDYRYDDEQIFDDQRPFWPIYLDAIWNDVHDYASFTPAVWVKFFKLSFLRRYRFQFLEHTIHQDIPFLMLLPLADRLTQLPYIFYYYYQRDESTMNSHVPAHYIQHFERIGKQLNDIKDSYWLDYLNSDMIIPTILMNHLSYNTQRIYHHLSELEQSLWLEQVYNFLEQNLTTYKEQLGIINPWPTVLKNEKAWKILISRFDKSINNKEKITLMRKVLFQNNYSTKKIIKMLLPYGLSLWLLEKRGWSIVITQKNNNG